MTPANLQCQRCNTANPPDAAFCFRCGGSLSAPPPPQPPTGRPTQTSNTRAHWIALAAVVAIVGACGLCGIIGKLSDRSTNTANANSNVTIAGNSTPSVSPTAIPTPSFADLQRRAASLIDLNKEEYVRDDLKPFDEVMQSLRAIPKTSKDYAPAQALINRLIQKSARITAEILVLGPKPANSPWDSRVDAVVEYLRANLNDYDSSEFVEWSAVKKIEVKGEPYWGVRLKLRAKNAFGAFLLRDTYYFIRQNHVVRTEGL
jgi:hypothetical protein